MTHAAVHTIQLDAATTRDSHYSPRYACIPRGGLKSYTGLKFERITCTAGHLWITLAGDPEDHVLYPGSELEIPDDGKVLISGPGCYRISKGVDGLDLTAA